MPNVKIPDLDTVGNLPELLAYYEDWANALRIISDCLELDGSLAKVVMEAQARHIRETGHEPPMSGAAAVRQLFWVVHTLRVARRAIIRVRRKTFMFAPSQYMKTGKKRGVRVDFTGH